jgi:signal transduction histidine kinase
MVTGHFSDRAHAAAGVWDALSLNRRLATTSAGAEMAVVAAFLGLRAVNVVQVAASLPTGLAQSPNPGLDTLMVTAFMVETAVLAVVALRRASLRLSRFIWADVSLGCVLLLGQKLISSPDLMLTWDAWGYAVTLSCAMAAGFGLRRRAETVVAAGALTVCFLLVTVNLSGSVDQLSTAATNSLSYVAFAGLGRGISGYLRRLGGDADEARQRAAALGAEAETERHRGLLHDQATVLSLLSQNPTDVRLQMALRQQAANGATRIAAFMSGVQDSNLTAGTLGAAVRSAVAQFPDLPLTCTTDLADELDLPAPVAAAVAGAVTTLLHNVRRHAGAAGCVVHADADPDTGWWEVLVRDDGNGFTPQTTPRGYGLAQQVEAAMGRIGVQVSLRSAMGEGTLVTLTHPSRVLAQQQSPETPAKPGDLITHNASIMNA